MRGTMNEFSGSAALFFLLLAGCASGPVPPSQESESTEGLDLTGQPLARVHVFAPDINPTNFTPAKPSTDDKDPLLAMAPEDGAAGAGAPQAADQKPAPQRRLMIYTARFELLVANVKESIQRFQKSVTDAGGYLQSLHGDTIVCRVPARAFDAVVASVPSFGVVVDESIQAEEVTRAHLDLTLRIETAEKARERLLKILERAQATEDVLKIEQEVRRLTEEIERMKGELKLLEERIAYSTVEVRFRSAAPEPKPMPLRRQSRFPWINAVGVEHALASF